MYDITQSSVVLEREKSKHKPGGCSLSLILFSLISY